MKVSRLTGSLPGRLDRACVTSFGRLDILVNNAAHSEPTAIDALEAEVLDRHYAVKLRATALLCAEFARRSRLVRFLASDEAAWITGQIIRSRGGA